MRPENRAELKSSPFPPAKRLRDLVKGQSGIVMPLAMVMVMLISVVGAGLLVFVVSDNSSAAQVNRGQKAFGMADAGVAAAQSYLKMHGDLDGVKSFTVPTGEGSTETVNVTITSSTGDDGAEIYTVESTGSAAAGAQRKVEAVFQKPSPGGGGGGGGGGFGGITPTAPKNYYAGTSMTLNNYTEMLDGDILVEGRADITNTMRLTNGSVLVKGYGNFPNEKYITNGDFYVGGGATFSNTTTVNNGNIFVNGTPPSGTNTFANSTTVSGGGIYVGGPATFSNDTRITGGDLYVQGATRVGNLNVSAGGNVLIDGNFSVDNSLRLDNSYLYVNGDARIQNATITNSRIFINGVTTGGIITNGAAEFVQTNNITNSVIYVGGGTSFTNSGTLTGTSLFINGNINFSNAMTFGSVDDARYGNWKNTFNNTARGSTRTGVGATGTISGNPGSSLSKGTRSYDNTTNPRFVATVSTPQPSNRIRFPFDPANIQGPTLLANASSALADARTDAIQRIEAGRLSSAYLDALKEQAISQSNYREVPNGQQELVVTPGQYRPEQRAWPENSDYTTVVYYKFPSYDDNNRVQWLIRAGCTNQDRKGILVIENGVFSSYSSGSGFNGTIVLRNGKFDVSGDYCMNGYVNSDTSFTSSNSSRFNLGDVPPLSEIEFPPGGGGGGGGGSPSGSAERISWREVYE